MVHLYGTCIGKYTIHLVIGFVILFKISPQERFAKSWSVFCLFFLKKKKRIEVVRKSQDLGLESHGQNIGANKYMHIYT